MTYMTASCAAAKPRRSVLALAAQRLRLWKQRRDLEKLDARALDDIGISAFDAQAEARRPIWDAPESWRL